MATEQPQDVNAEEKPPPAADGESPQKSETNGSNRTTEADTEVFQPRHSPLANGKASADDGQCDAHKDFDIAKSDKNDIETTISTSASKNDEPAESGVVDPMKKSDTSGKESNESEMDVDPQEEDLPPANNEVSDAPDETSKNDVNIEPQDVIDTVAESSHPIKSGSGSVDTTSPGVGDDNTKGAHTVSSLVVNGMTDAKLLVDAQPAAQDVDFGSSNISHLAIDKDPGSSHREGISDVTMSDVADSGSTTGVKVARERDDGDGGDEPAAKRAKTEPLDDAPDNPPGTAHLFAEVPHWGDEALAQLPITDWSCKQYRRIMTLVKKIAVGYWFKESVEKMWPASWQAYAEQIEKPIDITEIDRNLRDGVYTVVGDLRRDFGLLYTNSVAYNGPGAKITNDGLATVKYVWEKVVAVQKLPTAAPTATTKKVPTRHAEPRVKPQSPVPPTPPTTSTQRRQSSSAVISPTEKAADNVYAIPPGGVPQIRRASTLSEGSRPKRTIQAPKPKDIDYTPRNVKKNKKPEIQFCEHILAELMDPKHARINEPFMLPVDPVAQECPSYFNLVKKPMDFSTIRDKLSKGEYATAKQFVADVELVFSNCFLFNGDSSEISRLCRDVQLLYRREWDKKSKWLSKNTRGSSPPPPSNPASDAESEEEEEVPVKGSDSGHSESINLLQKKLAEEMNKLTSLFTDAKPNQVLIQAQQGIVKMVQDLLLAEKEKVAQQPKSEKPAKAKAPRQQKQKAPAKENTAVKKSGSSKKNSAPKKAVLRTFSQEEKNAIADNINDLVSPHIDRAIEIILADTGQAGDGDLELDIDLLSNDAIGKLWDICKKAIPNFGKNISPPQEPGAAKTFAKAGEVPTAPRPKKKNKPMSAAEQERRIQELQNARAQFDPPSANTAAANTTSVAQEESSDESSSEEE